MVTNDELRVNLTNQYFMLLEIKALNKDKEVVGLQQAINRVKATMLEPDISWVEKQVAEAYS